MTELAVSASSPYISPTLDPPARPPERGHRPIENAPAPDKASLATDTFSSRGLTPTGRSAEIEHRTELINGANASVSELQATDAARLAYDIRQRLAAESTSIAEGQKQNIATLLL